MCCWLMGAVKKSGIYDEILFTLFDRYDFSGKTIIPFNTHEGSGDGGTYKTIAELEPDAKIVKGLAIRGFDVEKDQNTAIGEWLKNLGFKER